tara:strand:+ start:15782 stop:18145 length:2364 start_codon:yes stop_codon:yes gene_type:complete
MPAGPTRKQLEEELKAAERTSDQLNVLLNLAKRGSARFTELSKRIFEVNSNIREMTKGIEVFDKKTEAIDKFTADLKKANKELEDLGDTTDSFGIDLAKSLDKGKEGWTEISKAAGKYAAQGKDLQKGILDELKDVDVQLKGNAKSLALGLKVDATSIDLLRDQLLTKQQIAQLSEEDREAVISQNNANRKLLNTLESHARIQEKINDATADMIPIVQQITDAFTSGAGFMIAAISAIETILLSGVQRTKELNTQLGIGVGESGKIAANLALENKVAFASGFGEEIVAAASAAADVSGNLDLARNSAIAVSDAAIAFQTGLDASTVAGLAETLTITTNLTREQASATLSSVANLAQQNKVAPKKVMEDLANSSADMAKFTDGSAESLAKAAVQAARLGITLSKSAQILDKMLSFEESITSQFEAEVLLGRELNFDRARQLALNNDIAGAVQEVVGQLGSEAEFNELNAIQRQALADSIGVGVEDLASMVAKGGKAVLEEDNLGEQQLKGTMDLIKQGSVMGGKIDTLIKIVSAGFVALVAGQWLTAGLGKLKGLFGKGGVPGSGIKPPVPKTGPVKTGNLGKLNQSKIKPMGNVTDDVAKNMKKSMDAGRIAIKEGTEATIKQTTKTVGKATGKSLLKKIPILGAVAGLGFATSRLLKGDFLGAALEVASGGASILPGAGTGASLGIDALLMARDIKGAFADGGTVSSAGTYLVGERGPELAHLPRGSSVVPNENIKGALAEGQFGQVDMKPVVAALNAMTAELREIKRSSGATATNTGNFSIGSSN